MKTGRKKSGGKYIKPRKKKAFEKLGQKIIVKLSDEDKRVKKRTLGGSKKAVLTKAKYVNVLGKDKKSHVLEIKNVLETPSNRFLARQNIITKGTIIQTEKGKVKVTSRPSQHGIINGILVE